MLSRVYLEFRGQAMRLYVCMWKHGGPTQNFFRNLPFKSNSLDKI